jgi:signal transduction histidine kinase
MIAGVRPRWRSRLSVRTRLTIAAAAVISVGMAIAAGLLLWRMYSVLATDLDNSLIQQAHAAAEDVRGGVTALRISKTAPASTALQVVDAGGRVLTSAGDVDGTERVFFTAPAPGEPTLTTVDDGVLEGPYRVAALTVPTHSGTMTLYLGAPTAPLSTIRHELGTSLAVGIPAAVLALTAVSWLLIGRALRPVETMRRQAAAIPGHDPEARLDVPATGDELGRLAETFNELLGRIATASEQQRRFLDDAAHELRSPLAALRTQLEVSQRDAAEVGEAESIRYGQRQVLGSVERLANLVNDLLVIARLDSVPPTRRHPVDLDDLVWDCVADARRHDWLTFDTTGVSPVRVIGDAGGLRRVVQNLLDNARRHARERITVRLNTDSRTATLSVADDGPGVPDADRSRIFDRFVRVDAGRAREDGGTGLGLAIVSSVVYAHDGLVWVDDGDDGGAVFEVRLPALSD